MISPSLPQRLQTAFDQRSQMGLTQRHKEAIKYLEWHRKLLFASE